MRFPLLPKEEIHKIVEAKNVCMESRSCKGTFVSGLIRVKNLSYEKQVCTAHIIKLLPGLKIFLTLQRIGGPILAL